MKLPKPDERFDGMVVLRIDYWIGQAVMLLLRARTPAYQVTVYDTTGDTPIPVASERFIDKAQAIARYQQLGGR